MSGQKRVSIRIVIGVCGFFLFACAALLMRVRTENAAMAAASTKKIRISLEETSWAGQYTGDMDAGMPVGEGQFVSEDGSVVCDGTWKDGKLEGAVEIRYSDGTVAQGTFHKGKADGLFRFIKQGSVTEEKFFCKGAQCGCYSVYEDGLQKEQELLVNGMPLPELMDQAVPMTRRCYEEKTYLGQVVSVSGEVLYVGQDKEECYCRIRTEEVGMIYFSYVNGNGDGADQAILPNMTSGDRVRIYGYLLPDRKDLIVNDMKGYGNSYLSFLPLYGELSQEEPNRENHERYPYHSYGLPADGIYIVQDSVLRDGMQFLFCRRQEETETSGFVVLETDVDDIERPVYLEGDVLEVEGYYNGQYKESSQADILSLSSFMAAVQRGADDIVAGNYSMYPLILVSDVQVQQGDH